jgi:hypothetical protein
MEDLTIDRVEQLINDKLDKYLYSLGITDLSLSSLEKLLNDKMELYFSQLDLESDMRDLDRTIEKVNDGQQNPII